MTLKSFLKLVEIQTKIASVFPFFIGILFVYYQFGQLNLLNTTIFFFAMLFFDLTTTAINNYMDFRKATDRHDFDYRKVRNVIGQENISERTVVTTIWTMLVIASGLGIWLVFRTDLLLLFIGMVCFFIGIFYTFGPIPLSRMPLGEIFCGVTMGLGIIFLAMYVTVYDTGIANLTWFGQFIDFRMDLIKMGVIVLVSIPAMFTIANLMLANNICDMEEDILNHRYTLPYYLGKKLAVILFQVLYYSSYGAIIVAVVLNVFHPIMLLSLLTFFPMQKNLMLFRERQVKSETFVVAVKNLVLVNGGIVICLVLSVLFFGS